MDPSFQPFTPLTTPPQQPVPSFPPTPQPVIIESPAPRPRSRGLLITAIILGLFAAAFAGVSIWAFTEYSEQKSNVDGKISLAVSAAKKEAADAEFKKYQEELQKPYTEFAGPSDYGRVTFRYPKTWSVYVAKDASKGGNYQAYLHPVTVPPVSVTQPFALRVSIVEEDYNKVTAKYDSLVKKGNLKSSTTSSDGQNGLRLDGSFTKNIRGAAVFYKVNDKTLVIQTDIDNPEIKAKFEEIIKTIKFNT